jgi:hypothetical protein
MEGLDGLEITRIGDNGGEFLQLIELGGGGSSAHNDKI